VSRVFTRLLVRHKGSQPDELVQIFPTDNYQYVIRNITLTNFGPTKADVIVYLRQPGGPDFWLCKEALETTALYHQEVRHAVVGGDELRVNTNSSAWDLYVTGYVLGPDS
jgi:hypothetical protein